MAFLIYINEIFVIKDLFLKINWNEENEENLKKVGRNGRIRVICFYLMILGKFEKKEFLVVVVFWKIY